MLGIEEGLVAITKADLVDEDTLELAKLDVKDLVKGTFLEDKPIICVSAITGMNLDHLLEVIDATVDKLRARDTDGPLFHAH